MAVDERKVEELTGRMVGNMTGAMVCFGAWLGDELGLYRALSGAGPVSADQLAAKTACHPRLVREWLDGQTGSPTKPRSYSRTTRPRCSSRAR